MQKRILLKPKLTALWACILLLGFILYRHLGDWLLGTSGLIRPSDAHDGMVEKKFAENLVVMLQNRFSSLFCWISVAFILLVVVAIWCSFFKKEREQ
jgi:hypothetical protein